MPILRTGKGISIEGSLCEIVELSAKLSGIGIGSELLPSTVFNSPVIIDGSQLVIRIPEYLVEDLYTLYNYSPYTNKWTKITDYSQSNDNIILQNTYDGILVAFPFDAFRENFQQDGQYVYEMILSRLDSKVYRNIIISSSLFMPSKRLSLRFSFYKNGPWLDKLNAQTLFSTFYMQISITGMSTLEEKTIIPSQIINLSCLVCK